MYNYGPDCVNPELAKADLMNVGFPKYEIEKGLPCTGNFLQRSNLLRLAGWLAGRAEAADAMQEADPVEHCDVTLWPRIRYIRLVGERSHPIPSKHLVQARIKDQGSGSGSRIYQVCL